MQESVHMTEGIGDIHEETSKPKRKPTALPNEHVSALHHLSLCTNKYHWSIVGTGHYHILVTDKLNSKNIALKRSLNISYLPRVLQNSGTNLEILISKTREFSRKSLACLKATHVPKKLQKEKNHQAGNHAGLN